MSKKITNKQRAEAPDEPMEIKTVPDDDLKTSRLYANYVEVSHSPADVTLTFCDMPSISRDRDEKKIKNGEMRIPVVAKIAVPVGMIENLIEALQIQYKEYQKTKDIVEQFRGKKNNENERHALDG